MSNEMNINLPSVEDSQALLDSIYQEAFFAKMAEYGHVPQTQEDAVGMLEAGYQLDQVEEKQASEKSGGYAAANSQLAQTLVDNGIDTGLATPSQVGTKQAAFALAQDPDLYKSVLTLRSAEFAEADQAAA